MDTILTPDMPQSTPLERVRYLMHVLRKTQAQFAQLIGLDPANLSRALRPGAELRQNLINRIVVNVGVSKEWLENGHGVPFPKDAPVREVSAGAHVSYDTAPRAVGAPVYDIDVTAGTMELSQMFTRDRVIGHMDMPGINKEFPIVRVYGDSMQPRIANGSFVSLRPISSDSPIFWGQIYVVILEDYRMVKYVRRHQNPEMVILHSANPLYDDMEVPRSTILKMFMVEAIFNYDITA